jgi:hypothetical protein
MDPSALSTDTIKMTGGLGAAIISNLTGIPFDRFRVGVAQVPPQLDDVTCLCGRLTGGTHGRTTHAIDLPDTWAHPLDRLRAYVPNDMPLRWRSSTAPSVAVDLLHRPSPMRAVALDYDCSRCPRQLPLTTHSYCHAEPRRRDGCRTSRASCQCPRTSPPPFSRPAPRSPAGSPG